MKKIILTLVFLVMLCFIPNIIYGQDIFGFKNNIPGITCGVAGDTTGKDKCCNIPNAIQCRNGGLDFVKGLLDIAASSPAVLVIPQLDYIPKKISNYYTSCDTMNKFINEQNNEDSACISGKPMIGDQSTSDFSNANCKCVDKLMTSPNQAMIEMCTKYLSLASTNLNELKNCLSCANRNGMWTGMGCLPLDLNTLISSFVLSTGIGIGGIFALLCIIYSAFMMQSSQGNPEKLKKAQEMITSCIMGLMLIIFSVLIMKIVGVNILKIPGFG